MNEYLDILLRLISIMTLLLFSTLYIIGKRPIGELLVYDFLSIVVIGSIVGADIVDQDIKHLHAVFAIIMLALLQKGVSFLSVRSKKFRHLVNFDATVVAHNGQLLHKNIKKISYTVSEILMLLREKDIFDLDMIAYAIIEPNGDISVLKKSEFEELTPKHMKMDTPISSMHKTVIFEGKFKIDTLFKTKYTEHEILEKLKEKGYKNITEVFFASIDENGDMNVSSYEQEDVSIE
ncbi:MAG: hypothetical protein K0R15_1494 [Clostridiales bacterium]|jgi:uncharacterized membrane protein YcaP (DUF421 family)|nr:hypothetical protein [Clostridiales bacterium]